MARRTPWTTLAFALVAVVLGLALVGRRRREQQRLLLEEARLGRPGPTVERFDPSHLANLPEPAQRYLTRAIAEGTPLATAVRLSVGGRLRRERGGPWWEMQAREVLAPGRGYVWRAVVSRAGSWVRGHDLYRDGRGERWWAWAGVVPVARAYGSDISRSSAGRLAAACIWCPSAFLPSRGAVWSAIDDDTAAVTLDVDGLQVKLEITVDDDGRLVRLATERWREADGAGRWMPYGVDTVTEERTFGGYTIPTRLRMGWDLDGRDGFANFQPVVHAAVYR